MYIFIGLFFYFLRLFVAVGSIIEFSSLSHISIPLLFFLSIFLIEKLIKLLFVQTLHCQFLIVVVLVS